MACYLVLLRGVNVGKAKRVPMADFKAVLLGLGCTRATTLLNSGNAVVEHAPVAAHRLAAALAPAMRDRFGFEVPVVVKSGAELDEVVAGLRFDIAQGDHPRVLVAFGQAPEAVAGLKGLSALVVPPEQLQVGEHAAYLYCPHGVLQSKLADTLLGRRGQGLTTRNWATVLKLQALVHAQRG